MNKVNFSLLLSAIIVLFYLSSCKKGDNDPFISLRTRKARLTGEWSVSRAEFKRIETTSYVKDAFSGSTSYAYTSTKDITTTFSDAGFLSITKSTSDNPAFTDLTVIDSGAVNNFTYIFKKDGTWSSNQEYTIKSYLSIAGFPVLVNYLFKTDRKGTWQFQGKNKNLNEKNKESISMSITEEIISKIDNSTGTNQSAFFTYGKNENTEVWHLKQLKNKEIQADFEINNSKMYKNQSTTSPGFNGDFDPISVNTQGIGVSKIIMGGSGNIVLTRK